MMPIARKLTSKDWQALRAIRLEALTLEPGKLGGRLAKERNFSPTDWCQWLDDTSGAVFGLFVDGELVGMACVLNWEESILPIAAARFWPAATPGLSTAFCIGSYLRTDFRSAGLSWLLHDTELAWVADNQGFCRVATAYRASNRTTRNIAERYGLRTIETRPYVWPDGEEEDIVICTASRTELQRALQTSKQLWSVCQKGIELQTSISPESL